MFGGLLRSLRRIWPFGQMSHSANSAQGALNDNANRTDDGNVVGNVVIFIHGLNSNAADCWLSFPELLQKDPAIAVRYDRMELYQYPTSLTTDKPLADHANALHHLVQKLDLARRITSLTFIAHSQGGLLARRYLADRFKEQSHQPLASQPIYRLLTFATPHWGAFSTWAQKALDKMPLGRQVADLGYDSPTLLALNKEWASVGADTRVEMLRVVAGDDWVVPEFSAMGADHRVQFHVVPGHGHGSVVKVTDMSHPSYGVAKEFLDRPLARHPHIQVTDQRVPVLKLGVLQSKNMTNSIQRLLYLARWIPLMGRDPEWQELKQFIAKPLSREGKPISSPIAWLWLEGPGGVGKSRLALELCLVLQEADWHAGFLSRESTQQPDWTVWQPALPTVMVVDYATTDIEQLSRMLSGLCQRDPGCELRHPVRVLLLERSGQCDRLLQATDAKAGHAHIQNVRHHVGPHRSDALSLTKVADSWPLMEAYVKRAKPGHALPDRAAVLNALRELDPDERPLYALMVTDALASDCKVEGVKVGREQLLESFLRRERQQFWCAAAQRVGKAVDDLLPYVVAATVCGGIRRVQMEKDASPPRGLEPWTDSVNSFYGVVSGYTTELARIEPLEPDLLGEFFVLEFWKGLADDDRNKWMSWLFCVRPLQTAVFLNRLGQDFPERLTLAQTFVGTELKDAATRLFWSMFLVNFLARQFDHCVGDKASLPHEGFTKLRELAAAHPQEPELRLLQAKAAFHLIRGLGKQDLAKAAAVYGELSKLAAAHPQEPELRLGQAMALVNLITDFGAQDQAKAEAVYGEFGQLAAAHPQEPELRLLQAKATVILINRLGKQDLAKGEAVYGELSKLAAAHPQESELRLEQATAVVSLIHDLGKQDLPKAVTVYGELTQLAAAHPQESLLRLWQGKATVILINGLGEQDLAKAEAVYGELSQLAAAHPQEPELRLLQAKAAFNLINGLRRHDISAAQARYDELSQLAATQPQEPELRLVQAEAAFNLIHGLRRQDMSAALARYDELSQLAAAHPQESELWLRQAKAAFNLINGLGEQDLAKAEAVYGELSKLATAHPQEPKLRLTQAEAAFNLITGLGKQDLAKAEAVYVGLSQLAADHPHESELWLEQAKAAFNLITDLVKQDLAKAEVVYVGLSQLAAAHPQEHEPRALQAKAAFNLIRGLGEQDLAKAEAVYGELSKLAAAHPQEPELRLEQATAAVNLIIDLGKQDLAKTEAVYGELSQLAAAHPQEPELRLMQAKAAFNLIQYLRTNDQAKAEAVHGELSQLASQWPLDVSLQEVHTRALGLRRLWHN